MFIYFNKSECTRHSEKHKICNRSLWGRRKGEVKSKQVKMQEREVGRTCYVGIYWCQWPGSLLPSSLPQPGGPGPPESALWLVPGTFSQGQLSSVAECTNGTPPPTPTPHCPDLDLMILSHFDRERRKGVTKGGAGRIITKRIPGFWKNSLGAENGWKQLLSEGGARDQPCVSGENHDQEREMAEKGKDIDPKEKLWGLAALLLCRQRDRCCCLRVLSEAVLSLAELMLSCLACLMRIFLNDHSWLSKDLSSQSIC